MESSSSKMNPAPNSIEKEEYMSDLETYNKFKQILSTIPKKKGAGLIDLYQYEGFWYAFFHIPGVLLAQEHFKLQPNQVILSCFPKCGTTWLKALAFAITTRSYESDPTNPYKNLKPTRIEFRFSTCIYTHSLHFPTKIHYKFWLNNFCEPIWDHILGYWRASMESPERILFIKFEDLKNETIHWVKKLAQFIDYPFSLEEEKRMVQKIIDLCSFENMSNLEVNKNGKLTLGFGIKKDEVKSFDVKNNMYFRKGSVGDWKNHLTPAMAKRIDQMTGQKLTSYGLTWSVT
ncbi:hypothetical protein ACB092_10G034900 [Castanea dentata]